MKITFVGHASILVEAGGVAVLSDPWWRGPCFGAQWWNYPKASLAAVETTKIDYIYISHGHHDHFHPGTLKTLSRETRVLVSGRIDLAAAIRTLGFNVIEIDDDQELALTGDVRVRIMRTHGADTLMTITDGQEVCVNLNDALHSAPSAVQDRFIARLRSLFPRIDYVFCGYGVASHFPNCYLLPGKDRVRTAALRQSYFNRQWVRIVHELSPKWAFPFAADVVLLDDALFWVNEPTHNAERPTAAFLKLHPSSPVNMRDIAPGFSIVSGVIGNELLREPILEETIRADCEVEIERANARGAIDIVAVEEVATHLRNNVDMCAEYLGTFDGDYRFLIEFRYSSHGLIVAKRGKHITLTVTQDATADKSIYDFIYTVRLPYLKWSLTMPYGDELLFVGSGGLFEYFDRGTAFRNVHRELIALLRAHARAPTPRYGDQSKLVYEAKRLAKRLLRRTEPDLYDLSAWTILAN